MTTQKRPRKSTTPSNAEKPKKKRAPKGFVSFSIEAVSDVILIAIGQAYMAGALKGIPTEDFPKLLDGENWLASHREFFETQAQMAAQFASLTPIFEEIRKSKNPYRTMIWNYCLMRLDFQFSGKLEKSNHPTPTENDELLELAFQSAIGIDETFRLRVIREREKGEDSFNNWYCDTLRKDCLAEFRGIYGKYKTVTKVYARLLERFQNEQFDKK